MQPIALSDDAGMGYFFCLRRAQAARGNRHNGYRFTAQSDELNLVARAITVQHYNPADIARFQATFEQISRQNDGIKFRDQSKTPDLRKG